MTGFIFEANQRIKAERDSAGNTLAPLTTNERMRFAMADTVQSQNTRERKITQELLRCALNYDPDTGTFTWRYRPERSRQWNTRYAGRIAGKVDTVGRRMIGVAVDGTKRQFFASRLAFIYMTGFCPPLVDHKDGDRGNNRWKNLRAASPSQNLHNTVVRSDNRSGFKGVDWNAEKGKWRAVIHVNKRQKHLGYFLSVQEAHNGYCIAAEKYFGEFACPGFRST